MLNAMDRKEVTEDFIEDAKENNKTADWVIENVKKFYNPTQQIIEHIKEELK